MAAKKEDNLEILQLLLANASKVDTVDLDIYGKTLTLGYRRLGWRKLNKAMSFAMEYAPNNDGGGNNEMTGTFRMDKYYVLALNEMIINPPFPLTDTFWDALPQEAGEILQKLVPDPFALGNSMGAETEELGKISGASSEEEESPKAL